MSSPAGDGTGAGKAAGRKAAPRRSAGGKTGARGPSARGSAASKARSPAKRKGRRIGPEKRLAIVERMAERDPHPVCALDHANPFELTAATILSAQCTDERVNMVTPQLFARWPTPADLAGADQAEVEEVIHSTGFFRNKAKNLIGMARRLVEAYDGEVPRDMDALLTLPGVARKTANVVRGECFGLADGVVVDTHVSRLSRRMGFSCETDPVRIERDLMDGVPREHWIAFAHRLIRHGRTVCPARAPRCDDCYLAGLCPARGV